MLLRNYVSELFARYPLKDTKRFAFKSEKTLLKEECEQAHNTIFDSRYKCYIYQNINTIKEKLLAVCEEYENAVKWVNNASQKNLTIRTVGFTNKPFIIEVSQHNNAIVQDYDSALRYRQIYKINDCHIRRLK